MDRVFILLAGLIAFAVTCHSAFIPPPNLDGYTSLPVIEWVIGPNATKLSQNFTFGISNVALLTSTKNFVEPFIADMYPDWNVVYQYHGILEGVNAANQPRELVPEFSDMLSSYTGNYAALIAARILLNLDTFNFELTQSPVGRSLRSMIPSNMITEMEDRSGSIWGVPFLCDTRGIMLNFTTMNRLGIPLPPPYSTPNNTYYEGKTNWDWPDFRDTVLNASLTNITELIVMEECMTKSLLEGFQQSCHNTPQVLPDGTSGMRSPKFRQCVKDILIPIIEGRYGMVDRWLNTAMEPMTSYVNYLKTRPTPSEYVHLMPKPRGTCNVPSFTNVAAPLASSKTDLKKVYSPGNFTALQHFGFAIYAKSKHIKMAKDFLTYILNFNNPKVVAAYLKRGSIPIYPGIADKISNFSVQLNNPSPTTAVKMAAYEQAKAVSTSYPQKITGGIGSFEALGNTDGVFFSNLMYYPGTVDERIDRAINESSKIVEWLALEPCTIADLEYSIGPYGPNNLTYPLKFGRFSMKKVNITCRVTQMSINDRDDLIPKGVVGYAADQVITTIYGPADEAGLAMLFALLDTSPKEGQEILTTIETGTFLIGDALLMVGAWISLMTIGQVTMKGMKEGALRLRWIVATSINITVANWAFLLIAFASLIFSLSSYTGALSYDATLCVAAFFIMIPFNLLAIYALVLSKGYSHEEITNNKSGSSTTGSAIGTRTVAAYEVPDPKKKKRLDKRYAFLFILASGLALTVSVVIGYFMIISALSINVYVTYKPGFIIGAFFEVWLLLSLSMAAHLHMKESLLRYISGIISYFVGISTFFVMCKYGLDVRYHSNSTLAPVDAAIWVIIAFVACAITYFMMLYSSNVQLKFSLDAAKDLVEIERKKVEERDTELERQKLAHRVEGIIHKNDTIAQIKAHPIIRELIGLSRAKGPSFPTNVYEMVHTLTLLDNKLTMTMIWDNALKSHNGWEFKLLKEIELYQCLESQNHRVAHVKYIYDLYFQTGAPMYVNIGAELSGPIQRALHDVMSRQVPPEDGLFDKVFIELMKLVKTNNIDIAIMTQEIRTLALDISRGLKYWNCNREVMVQTPPETKASVGGEIVMSRGAGPSKEIIDYSPVHKNLSITVAPSTPVTSLPGVINID